MKILCTSDWHLRKDTPSCRHDDFRNTQLNKIRQIHEIAKRNQVDFILHAGDFFNEARPDLDSFFCDMISELSRFSIPMYVVPGNHDMRYRNTKTLKSSGLQLLYVCKMVQPLIGLRTINGLKCFGLSADMNFNETIKTFDKVKPDIVVSHHMITPKPCPFDYYLVEDLEKPFKNVRVSFSGDWHHPFMIKNSKTLFLNTGSFTRQSSTEKKLTPSVTLLTIDNEDVGLETIPISFKAHETFLEETKDSAKVNFASELSQVSIDQTDIWTVFNTVVANKKVPSSIIDRSKQSLLEASDRLKDD